VPVLPGIFDAVHSHRPILFRIRVHEHVVPLNEKRSHAGPKGLDCNREVLPASAGTCGSASFRHASILGAAAGVETGPVFKDQFITLHLVSYRELLCVRNYRWCECDCKREVVRINNRVSADQGNCGCIRVNADDVLHLARTVVREHDRPLYQTHVGVCPRKLRLPTANQRLCTLGGQGQDGEQ
jgi:hypothetical protein